MIGKVSDLDVSRLIIQDYYEVLRNSLESDVIIVGGGPSGLVAGYTLAEQNKKVVIMEKRLSPGGGIWGGGKGFNKVVLESSVGDILRELDISFEEKDGYIVVSSVLLAASLIKKTVESGAILLNLFSIEDVYFNENHEIAGVVVNDTAYKMTNLHVDPLTFCSKIVMDSTGHDAVVCNCLARRGLIQLKGEQPMNAQLGEEGVVEGTREIYPGLIVTGMASAQFHGTCRMGPIFGGMLLSGKKAAKIAIEKLAKGC
ncbi:MAG: sulfide-dependent adenosine diphosphate thiazole synthase [Armatimonadota bacterium]|nr:sulfide-dependent adenosine diphosphate thiazole synthase [Armatimonadota bacterium]